MSQIIIYHIGKVRDKSILYLINEISKRLKRVKIVELKECKANTPDLVKLREFEVLEPILAKHNVVYLCMENGIEFSTQKFYDFTQKYDELVFIISGAFGPHEKTIQKASGRLSLSQMTFTHEMALFLLIEQCYRVECIKNNINYTK